MIKVAKLFTQVSYEKAALLNFIASIVVFYSIVIL